MIYICKKVARLFIGLFIMGVSAALMLQANLGMSPFGVLHSGIAEAFDITFGKACIIVGFVFIAISYLSGEKIGWGSLANMYFVGVFIDLILKWGIIPKCSSFLSGFIMLSFGMLLMGVSSFLYLSAGLGSGPRDGVMVMLVKKTGRSVALIKGVIECTALIIGYLMGGKVGMGTLYCSLSVGFYYQMAYRMCKFNVKDNNHRFIDDDIEVLKKITQ
jgi:uncharacterized membrane protein YczE